VKERGTPKQFFANSASFHVVTRFYKKSFMCWELPIHMPSQFCRLFLYRRNS